MIARKRAMTTLPSKNFNDIVELVRSYDNQKKTIDSLEKRVAKLTKENKKLKAKTAELDMDFASKTMRSYLEGMQVSVDVSTDDEATFGNRLFGTVSEVMDDSSSKNGVILLVTDVTPNF